jgi:hypothetical protein
MTDELAKWLPTIIPSLITLVIFIIAGKSSLNSGAIKNYADAAKTAREEADSANKRADDKQKENYTLKS